ncbi:hypothetical protein PROFUN_07207 [Planoprotostelium fungivorum]|uniref:Uncharacterized protein n=1 Tax=Planoprotostelium fungivorum TaxID=1890364 RepID=A0A2P6NME9_9EUKA|nr:hypothetical protein PROFUN_07207 [Planoprotostelium fungivorum]
MMPQVPDRSFHKDNEQEEEDETVPHWTPSLMSHGRMQSSFSLICEVVPAKSGFNTLT